MIKKFVRGKTLVLIDNANIIHAFSTLGFKLDHRKLKQYFKYETDLVGVYLYTAFIKTKAPQKRFLHLINDIGIVLKTKEVKFIRLPNGIYELKGDLDIEIAIDTFELLNQFETLVLFSGDSDFAPLVDWLHTKDKRVIVISTRPHISRELARAAGKFIDLGKFRQYWELK